MKIIKLYEPAIHTNPEDTLAFLLVERGSPEYYKLIMEYYINFMTIYDNVNDEIWLRFNNYLNWEPINLFTSFFMSRDIYQTFPGKLNLIRQLLNEDYCLMTYYDRYYISPFYGEHHSHTMAIYGYDDERQMFFCKDYMGSQFTNMEVPYTDFLHSVEKYYFVANAQLGFVRLGLIWNQGKPAMATG